MSHSTEVKWNTEQTGDAWYYLTKAHEARTRKYVEEGVAAVLRGGIKLTAKTTIKLISAEISEVLERREGPADISESMLEVTALRLDRSFGADGHHIDDDSWDACMAFHASLRVDWKQLADQLLRRYVPEYVPSDSSGTMPIVDEGGQTEGEEWKGE